ncbi:Uncharacterized protein dnl_60230 [Desulfonema limicola]|uniref:Phosphodiester glycosidase domain-containing protein n=1 Tax=Desulfonema limicola TaxID=45656 RepID=A0A975GJM1_9BACT|nr:hypothetical protein [Desulfonema limicola]QTA83610.1 Uncharacterized protein dnl_60230 [Desulfonema limicola]
MRIKLVTLLLLFTFLFGGSKIANSEDALIEPVDGLKLYEKRFNDGTKYYITEINLKKLDMHISLSEIKRNEPNYDTWQDVGSFHGRNPYFIAKGIHDFKLPSGETPIAISSGAFGGAWPKTCDHCEGYLTFPARSNGLLVAEGYGDPGGRDPNRTLIKDDTSKCNVLCYDNYNGVADIYPWYHIKDGQRCSNEFVSFTEEVVPSTSTGGRTFCGVADRDGNSQNETLLILTTSYASNEQVTQALRDFDATATIQFDGGGSSQLWVDGTDYVASSRPVWNTFVIGPKSYVPIIKIANFRPPDMGVISFATLGG